MKTKVLPIFLVAWLGACAAESYQKVPMPAQSTEVTSASLSRIYILRLPQTRGTIRGLRAKEDEREIGRIGSDSYLCWERKPGRTLVVVTYEGTAFEKDDRESVIDCDAEAGQAYYYGISIDPAWNKPVVQLLSKDDAVGLMRELKPAPAN